MYDARANVWGGENLTPSLSPSLHHWMVCSIPLLVFWQLVSCLHPCISNIMFNVKSIFPCILISARLTSAPLVSSPRHLTPLHHPLLHSLTHRRAGFSNFQQYAPMLTYALVYILGNCLPLIL